MSPAMLLLREGTVLTSAPAPNPASARPALGTGVSCCINASSCCKCGVLAVGVPPAAALPLPPSTALPPAPSPLLPANTRSGGDAMNDMLEFRPRPRDTGVRATGDPWPALPADAACWGDCAVAWLLRGESPPRQLARSALVGDGGSDRDATWDWRRSRCIASMICAGCGAG